MGVGLAVATLNIMYESLSSQSLFHLSFDLKKTVSFASEVLDIQKGLADLTKRLDSVGEACSSDLALVHCSAGYSTFPVLRVATLVATLVKVFDVF